MQMDTGEICRSYAAAKDKNGQIKVLAELNDCGVADIMQVLAAGGMISGLPKPKDKEKLQAAGGQMQVEKDSAGRLKWTPELEKEIIKLFEAGLSNGEIAAKLGLEKEQVRTKKARLIRAGYLFDAAKPAKRPKGGPKAETAPEKSKSAGKDTAGTDPLAMLYDNLSTDMTVMSAAVEFRDIRGECWRLQVMKMERRELL